MILSASRRTDIPALYGDWLLNRLRAGFVLVRNPVRPRQVARVSLAPEVLDGIVLWTKNPAPLMPRLGELGGIPYYFQYTLTAYGPDIEPRIPPKDEGADTLRRLADRIGPERVIWRYDPIFVGGRHTADFHRRAFEAMARRLAGSTLRCTVSVIDDYRATRRNAGALAVEPLAPEAQRALVAELAAMARAYGITMDACAEAFDLTAAGVAPARCVDAALLARIGGRPLRAAKDRSQRKACGCAASVDIGVYNTCQNGCLYCYASYDESRIPRNAARHDPASPMLIGDVGPEDVVYDRIVKSDAYCITPSRSE